MYVTVNAINKEPKAIQPFIGIICDELGNRYLYNKHTT
jgi:hypothetical protein